MPGTGKILIYDYGTTALKTVLYDEDINMLDKISIELNYEYPGENQVEIDAEKYWQMAVESTREIIERNNCSDTLELISLTSQAETLIAVDSNGKPLRKAIVWLDNRADNENSKLKESIDIDVFYRHTGLNEMDPIFPINKMLWIKENEGDIYYKTYKFLLLKDYIIYRLTGETVSDPSICSCSGCFDINKREWWPKVFDCMGLDMNKMPVVKAPSYIVGSLDNGIKARLGIKGNVKIMNGMMDQCGSAIGAGNIFPGILTETTGTAVVLASTIDSLSSLKLIDRVPIVCHGLDNKYLALPYAQTAGIVLKWFKDKFCSVEEEEAKVRGISVYSMMDKMVEGTKAVSPGLVMLPHFCGSMSPVNNPDAVGIIYGLNLNTGKSDIVKAIMESIAFLIKENVELLYRNGFGTQEVISLGGGARSDIWTKIKSDILEKRVITLRNDESTSYGCALLAGAQVGNLNGIEHIREKIKIRKEFLPDVSNNEIYKRKYELYKDLYAANEKLFLKSGINRK